MMEYRVYDAEGVFVGSGGVREQAVEAAKRKARKDGKPIDVVQVSDRGGIKRCRYWPDGTVERMWLHDGDKKDRVR
ncbi:MAG: hypothetical protein KBS74_06730 [Clostridiales bacterium]|nr:hypothetical protein [Candidatus Cacconaster stercorequi]